jgi:cytochrome c-type biogenesis protein CcmE
MENNLEVNAGGTSRVKFLVGGLLILAAVVYLIASSTKAGAQYFYTVEEMQAKVVPGDGKQLRVTGAVIGDTIEYDPETLTLKFDVAHMPADNELLNVEGGLAMALHEAVSDPGRTRMQVVYVGVKPDLLKNEAQAIMTGALDANGVFQADELLLKCPTKYEDAAPEQVDV